MNQAWRSSEVISTITVGGVGLIGFVLWGWFNFQWLQEGGMLISPCRTIRTAKRASDASLPVSESQLCGPDDCC